MLLMSEIELPRKQDPAAFGTCMRDEYFLRYTRSDRRRTG
jgi:hypothetical protein